MNKSVLLLLITLFLIPKEVKPQFSKEIIKQLQKQAKAQKAPVNLNTKYNLTNFGKVLNDILKSSKDNPLWSNDEKRKVWHRGKTTKLISIDENNTVNFQTDFYYRENFYGLKFTVHKTISLSAKVTYNKNSNNFDLEYKIIDIESVPEILEKWFEVNEPKYSQIKVPVNIKKLKDPKRKLDFKIIMPKNNELEIVLNIPINREQISQYR